jgi:hypothetical protein
MNVWIFDRYENKKSLYILLVLLGSVNDLMSKPILESADWYVRNKSSFDSVDATCPGPGVPRSQSTLFICCGFHAISQFNVIL